MGIVGKNRGDANYKVTGGAHRYGYHIPRTRARDDYMRTLEEEKTAKRDALKAASA